MLIFLLSSQIKERKLAVSSKVQQTKPFDYKKPFCTVEGLKAELLKADVIHEITPDKIKYGILVLVYYRDSDGCNFISRNNYDGKSYYGIKKHDLVNITKKELYYQNLYTDGSVSLKYNSLFGASFYAIKDVLQVLEYTEEDGVQTGVRLLKGEKNV